MFDARRSIELPYLIGLQLGGTRRWRHTARVAAARSRCKRQCRLLHLRSPSTTILAPSRRISSTSHLPSYSSQNCNVPVRSLTELFESRYVPFHVTATCPPTHATSVPTAARKLDRTWRISFGLGGFHAASRVTLRTGSRRLVSVHSQPSW